MGWQLKLAKSYSNGSSMPHGAVRVRAVVMLLDPERLTLVFVGVKSLGGGGQER